MLYAIYFVNVFLCPVNHKLNLLEGKTIEDEHGDLSEVFFWYSDSLDLHSSAVG